MMATVPHVTSSSGLRKFQADGFLFDRVYYKGVNRSGNTERLCELYILVYLKNIMIGWERRN
jgi:hypothetical protein